jgi:pimeloyl-ACP methyl ester carboxylesterase
VTIKLKESIQTQFRIIDGLSIRFAESEYRNDHALLLSPWPESLFAFEPIWSRLAEDTHLVAIDLPGFGHSERRDSLLTPRAMGEFVICAADAFGLENPHVVGPDVGTGAALFAAALSPGRLRSLVVGSGGSAFPLQLGGVVKEWVEAPDLETWRRADPRQIVAAAMGTLERHVLPASVREDYLSSYEGDRFVESMRYVRTYPTELAVLRDLLPEIQTRCSSSPARETRPCRQSTPSSSMSGCPRASLTSSTRGTSRGRTARTSTRRSSRAGGTEVT